MSERTEEATPRRVEEARRRGEVGASRDAVAVAALVAGAGALGTSARWSRDAFRGLLHVALRAAAGETVPTTKVLARALALVLAATAPVLGAALAGAALVAAVQTGFLFAPTAAAPKLERVNVLAAF